MYKILIIGAGQLGSRHLQGVLRSEHTLQVTVVDTSSISLVNAEQREKEVIVGNLKTRVLYFNQIPIQEEYDVLIIATTASVRAMVTEEVLKKNKVKHIIFEKVLFQKLEDYHRVSVLLNKHDTQGWVNCPRRIYPMYQQLKELLGGEQSVNMELTGDGWGLACNSIHFADVYAYITSARDFDFSTKDLVKKKLQSKRDGYYEALGELHCKTEKGNFKLICSQNKGMSCSIVLKTTNYDVYINELEGFYKYQYDGITVRAEHKTLYQSELSGVNIDELIKFNESSLTSFEESCSIHIPFIEAMQTHFELSLGEKLSACPIT